MYQARIQEEGEVYNDSLTISEVHVKQHLHNYIILIRALILNQ